MDDAFSNESLIKYYLMIPHHSDEQILGSFKNMMKSVDKECLKYLKGYLADPPAAIKLFKIFKLALHFYRKGFIKPEDREFVCSNLIGFPVEKYDKEI